MTSVIETVTLINLQLSTNTYDIKIKNKHIKISRFCAYILENYLRNDLQL